MQFPSTTQITVSELFVPSKSFDYGLYQLKLTVQMYKMRELISSSITYVEILRSPIEVNLVEYRQKTIIRKQNQTFILDPGRFSIDYDQTSFNSTVCFFF